MLRATQILAALAVLLAAPAALAQDWTQIGGDIDGEAAYDYSGRSVSLSGDRLAVGAPNNDGNGSLAGHTRVFEWDAATGTWAQLGADIDGEAGTDQSGASVSLSGDRVAIGAYSNDGAGPYAGHVRVYQWDAAANGGAGDWAQMGTDIDGEAAFDQSGTSVSLSGDRVAIGAINNGGNGDDAGHTRVFEWDAATGTWAQLGADIDGEAAFDQSGASVSLSGDRVAIGAAGNDGNGSHAGHTRVFEWDAATGTWAQLGADIDGEAAFDYSGSSVSLSGDRVAIGAYGNDENGAAAGHTRVFEWDAATGTWAQLGADFDGEAGTDYSGWSVSLSGDRVAIGATNNDGNGDGAGHTRVFEWDAATGTWAQLGADFDGEAAHDAFGHSVSLDGDRLAVGAPNNDGNGTDAGHARVFALSISVPEWTVALAAGDHAAGTVGGTHRDAGNRVGMADGATDGLDDGDAPEPPAPSGDHVRLYIDGPADHLSGSQYMRQTVGALDLAGATYDFSVVLAAQGYDGQEVALEATDLTGLADGYSAFVVDGETFHDLSTGPYVFTYTDGAQGRALTVRVGDPPVPTLAAGSDPAGLPATGSTLALGETQTLTWDPDVEGAFDVAVEVTTDGGTTWVVLAVADDPSTGSFAFTPTFDLVTGALGFGVLGQELTFRTVARNVLREALELGRTTATFDFGAPTAIFDDGAGTTLASDLTADQAAPVPVTLTNAASAALAVSLDNGNTWVTVGIDAAGVDHANAPSGDLSQPFVHTFTYTAPAGTVAYAALARLTLTHRDGTETAVTSDALTVVPASAPFELAAGFEMTSLAMGAGALTPDDVFVDGTTGEPVSPLFVFTYLPESYYTLVEGGAAAPAPAVGFWTASNAATGSFAGTAHRAAQSVALGAPSAYMVGAPFLAAVSTSGVSFSDGSETKTYDEAVTDGWVAAGLYTWDPVGQTYESATALAPWRSYWLPVMTGGLTMTVAPPVPAPPSAKLEAPEADKAADEAPVRVLALNVSHENGASDLTTALVVAEGAEAGLDRLDRPEPPAAPVEGAVRAYSVRPDWSGPFAAYDVEAWPALQTGEVREWPLVVEAPAGAVTVTWSAPATDGPALSFELVDGGTRTAVADGGTYTFTSDGSPRSLTVLASPAGSVSTAPDALPTTFSATLAPNPARGAGAVLVASPEAGELSVAVYDVLGREVATVEQAVSAGVERIALPLSRLAPGAYVVRVEGPGGVVTERLTVIR